MSKQEENRNDIEENPTDKILEKIEQDKRKVKKSAVLAFAALIAIIALGIAWFVSNTKVTGTSSSVAAEDDNPFWLASVGERQNVELRYLKDDTNKNILSEGKVQEYSSYIDTKTGKEVSTDKTQYHVGTADLAWYLNGQEGLVPGASGKLEFYIIPRKTGTQKTKAEVSISLEAYQVSNSKALKYENETLQKLINGHILLFQNLDDTQGYSGWLYKDGANKITIDAPEGGFKEDMPYKVTIYWVWPKYFRNYVYDARNAYGDLFADITNNADYTSLNNYLNENQDYFFEGFKTENKIDNKMSDDTLDDCDKYYNEADEYIGKSKCYIYIDASVE